MIRMVLVVACVLLGASWVSAQEEQIPAIFVDVSERRRARAVAEAVEQRLEQIHAEGSVRVESGRVVVRLEWVPNQRVFGQVVAALEGRGVLTFHKVRTLQGMQAERYRFPDAPDGLMWVEGAEGSQMAYRQMLVEAEPLDVESDEIAGEVLVNDRRTIFDRALLWTFSEDARDDFNEAAEGEAGEGYALIVSGRVVSEMDLSPLPGLELLSPLPDEHQPWCAFTTSLQAPYPCEVTVEAEPWPEGS